MSVNELIARIEEEQGDIRATLKELQKACHQIEVDLAGIKTRLTLMSFGATALVGFVVWLLQQLLLAKGIK